MKQKIATKSTVLTQNNETEIMKELMSKSLKELREMQSIIQQQIQMAYAKRMTAALNNLEVKEAQVFKAILSKTEPKQ